MKMRTRSARRSQGAGTANAALVPNPTQTVVRINQAQSIHIVQTTVSAALCTILWINEYFPDDHFETRSYSLDDPAFPYRIKTQAQTAEERTQQGDEKARVTWDFLRRGKTKEADKIWLWLVRIHSPFPPFTLLTKHRTESAMPSSVDIWQHFRLASTSGKCRATP